MTSPHPEAAPAGTTTTEVLAHKLRLLRRAAHLTLQQTLNLHLVCPLGTDMTLRLERRIKRTVCIFLKSSNIP